MNPKKRLSHSLWIRWTHWINFPLLTIMIWSGAMIYWANDIYWPPISDGVYRTLSLDHHLALGLAVHFFFMWFFAVNGFLYAGYVIFSGEWRELVPQKRSLRESLDVILHDLGLNKKSLPVSKFNAAQRIAYTAIVVMGLGSLLTGLAIYKPVQLGWLRQLEGGYETARLLHYLLTVGYILFFFIHVAQVVRAGWQNFLSMVGRQWGFATLIVGFALCILVLTRLFRAETSNGTPWPFRKAMNFNTAIWQALMSPEKTNGVYHSPPDRKPARVNGDLGLKSEFDQSRWVLTVASTVGDGQTPQIQTMTLDDLKRLPRVEIVTQFRCIEGWSEIMSFAGVRFTDFMTRYHVGTHSGNPPDWRKARGDLFGHVGLETPDGEYYVSVDMKSMLNPETLLAYEQNGMPLTIEHGAPLRLVMPNKYGVKSLKRVGRIFFAESRLPDYWGEQGYDWFIGL